MVPFRYNVRSLLVRKITTIVTALGIALVVFVFAAAQMLSEGVKAALGSSGKPDNVVVMRKDSEAELSSTLSQEKLSKLKAMKEVGGGTLIPEIVVVVTAELADNPAQISNVLVRGTPPEGYAFRPEIRISKGRMPVPNTNEAIVGKGIAGRFKGIDVGGSIELRTSRVLTIVGEFTANGTSYESEVLADRDTIQSYLGRTYVSSARVRLANVNDFDSLKLAVASDKDLEVKVMREEAYFAKQSEMTAGFLGGMGTMAAFLFSLAAMIGAAITMNGAIASRSKEIGTLRALGFSRRGILLSFILEAMFLALIGGAIGLAFVMLLSFKTFTVVNFQTFSDIVIQFRATPNVVISSLIASVVMGLIGGLAPAIRASRISPVEAMRA